MPFFFSHPSRLLTGQLRWGQLERDRTSGSFKQEGNRVGVPAPQQVGPTHVCIAGLCSDCQRRTCLPWMKSSLGKKLRLLCPQVALDSIGSGLRRQGSRTLAVVWVFHLCPWERRAVAQGNGNCGFLSAKPDRAGAVPWSGVLTPARAFASAPSLSYIFSTGGV